MRTGEAIVRLLEHYGVDVVFGIPGTHSIELYRGLSGSSIRHVLPRHEQGAGFMADGFARRSGKPGVCFVITGPGVTNIATAMAQAYSDSVPMLVISPVNDPDADGRNLGRLHELTDQAAVTRPLTVWSAVASSTDEIPLLLARAFESFHAGRPGPVHLHIRLSVLRATLEHPWPTPSLTSSAALDVPRLDGLVAQLRESTAPVILAGGGLRHFGELVAALAEKIPAPVITTTAARGVIPGTHPLCPGAQLGAPQVRELLAQSDLVLVLGSEVAETDYWTAPLQLPAQQIWVNLDAGLLALRGQGQCLRMDARQFVLALTAALPPVDRDSFRLAAGRCRRAREQHGATFTTIERCHWRVLTELRKHLPADAVVCSDMTQLAYTAVEHLPLEVTNSWFHPTGYGTLGYALPAAIGVKLASPGVPVLAIVGDSGLQYTGAEMGVAAELGINIVVLLWQNDALMQIRDDMVGAGIEPNAVAAVNPDFMLLARAHRWAAERVPGLAALGSALEHAFQHPGPVLLELRQSEFCNSAQPGRPTD